MNYSEINLHENIQKGLSEAGYLTCTPVQEQVLQNSLNGSDLYVQSQTGTGKTAAYLVSIMQEMLNDKDKKALVLVPTRELATQVEEEAKKLGKYTGLKIASFFGGVGYEKQIAKLKKGVDIFIGTPGRIIDLQESKQMDLSSVSYLAVDEADRMFDMGFYPELRKILPNLVSNENRQTMLFSATLNLNVKNLAYEYTLNPKEITIEAENITVDEIEQILYHVSSDDKNSLLIGLIQKENPESFIIFCNTKKMCEVVSKRLSMNDVENDFIIGDLPQKKRQQIMNDFKSRKIKCLIATDVAARGIDVNDLQMVINYDLPNEAENYVHRIGRTARAGKSGKAYSFCTDAPEDAFNLMGIESYIDKKIPFIVATQDDFGEDKSKDTWIKTGDWKDSSKRSKKRPEKKSKNKKSSNLYEGESKKGQFSDEEVKNMSHLSLEERMKLYKEKYAQGANAQGANAVEGENTQVQQAQKKKKHKKKRKNQKDIKNVKIEENSQKDNSSTQQNTQTNLQPEKKGLFAKIKFFFTGK